MALPITISNKGLAVTISENGFGLPVVIVSGEVPEAQAPALQGGALTKDGSDLVITAPVVTAGSPNPSVTLTLTRDGSDVRGEVVNGRIPNAAPGVYVATWTASNGVGSPATATDTETVSATAPGQFASSAWELETGTGPSELRLNIISLPATGGSAITALEYNVDGGDFISLSGLNVGARVLTMPQGGTAYSVTVRAVNAVGAGTASEAKVATSNVVPAITATVSPNPLVAGQPGTVTFNAAPDSVTGSVTFTGSGLTRSFTAPSDDAVNVTIGATKAGYTAFSDVFDVAPALPELAVNAADSTAILRNLTPDSPADALIVAAPSRYAGTHPFDPSDLSDGPLIVVAPALTVDGDNIDLDLGIQIGATYWDGAPHVDGVEQPSPTETRYVVQPADQGKSIDWRGSFFDGAGGEAPFQTAPYNAPAAPSGDIITPVGMFTTPGVTTGTKTIPVNLGEAHPDKHVIFIIPTKFTIGETTLKIISGGIDYPLVLRDRIDRIGGGRICIASGDVPVGGEATLSFIGNSNTVDNSAYLLVGHNIEFAHSVNARVARSEPGLEVSASLTSNTAIGDYLIAVINSEPAGSGGTISDPIGPITEIHDAVPPGDTVNLWIAGGMETENTSIPKRKLGGTFGATGDTAIIGAAFRSK